MEKHTENNKRGLDDDSKLVSKRKNSSSSSTSDSGRSRHTDEYETKEGKSEMKEENGTVSIDEEVNEKKKENFKGKLFQCTGYPGCSMVFTRSEHLARHIRKHTGERPFECGTCKKRFSRLDNLRQHKQTVHLYDFDRNIKVSKKTTKKLKKGDEPITPSVVTEFNTLSSPPNSISPQIKRIDNKLPPPPPRQPIFLQKHESFSDTRNNYNKPMPLVLDNNNNNTNDGLRIITPTTGTGSIMETNSPNGRLNQLKLQVRSGSAISPSISSFNGVNSPGINLVGPMSMGSVPENLSPYGLMFGSNSTTVTPTNASFDFQRQSTYTPSVYYQRNNRSVQYQMNNTPNKALHQLRRESFNQRGAENGEEEENNQNFSNQYITYVPFGQMNIVSPINQYTPIGQPNVSPLLNQMGQPNSIYNPLLGHLNQLGPMNQIYNQYSSTPVSYVPYVSQFPQPNFSQNISQPPSATSKSFPNLLINSSISTFTENKTSSIPSLTSTGQSTLSSTDKHDSKYETVQSPLPPPPPLPNKHTTTDSKLQMAGVIESESKEGEVGTNKAPAEGTESNSDDDPSYGSNCKKRILLESILNG